MTGPLLSSVARVLTFFPAAASASFCTAADHVAAGCVVCAFSELAQQVHTSRRQPTIQLGRTIISDLLSTPANEDSSKASDVMRHTVSRALSDALGRPVAIWSAPS